MTIGFPRLQRGKMIAAGLVGAWAFYENSGPTVYDLSGQENHATLTGTSWVAGRNGAAVSFAGNSGSNAVCAAGAIAASHDFSVVAFCSPGSVSIANAWIVSQGASTGTDRVIQCGMHNGNPEFNFWGDDWQPFIGSMSVGEWYWLVWTYVTASKTRAIYSNGALLGTNTSSGNPLGGGVLKFGGDASLYGGSPWSGRLGEVRVYNRTLSGQEIAQISAGLG
jgi:hypothetical protein